MVFVREYLITKVDAAQTMLKPCRCEDCELQAIS